MIGRITPNAIKIAGIDVTVLKLHLTSVFLDARLTLEQVMKLGSWKSSRFPEILPCKGY
jgi:hypothetical protein